MTDLARHLTFLLGYLQSSDATLRIRKYETHCAVTFDLLALIIIIIIIVVIISIYYYQLT